MKKLIFLLMIVIFGAVLRFSEITTTPPGLYIDEASIGYNAYSILISGRDEHGEQFPIFFKAFGEYKLPVYIYLTSGSMQLFGKTDFAVRFPSALFGTLTILIVYYLVKELFVKFLIPVIAKRNRSVDKTKTFNAEVVALLAAFILAISPWHIHFSRGGFEATVALFFYLLGILLSFVYLERYKFKYIFVSAVAFIIATYTYNSYRIDAPLTFLLLIIIQFFQRPKIRKQIVIVSIIFMLLILPIVYFSLSPGGSARFNDSSAFTEYKALSDFEKTIVYPMVYIQNYISYFSIDFLFGYGDQNGRHQLPGKGLFYIWQLPFLVIGIVWLLRQKRTALSYVIFGLLLIAPLIPAVARPSPHTLRSLLMVIPLIMLISIGIAVCLQFFNKWKLGLAFVFLVACYEFSIYVHGYTAHYPIVNALDWGAGYKQTAEKAALYKKDYEKIIVDNNLSFALIYFKYYAPGVPIEIVDVTWSKPKDMDENILFIRPSYGQKDNKRIIDQVYLPGPNKDVFAQFWKL